MSEIPAELKYVASHEWVRVEDDGTVTIGVTHHAQDLLGDVVFVELPDVGAQLSAGDDAGVVESVKAASDIYAPLSGEVVAINEDLEDSPELVNSDPFGDGWFFRMKLSDTVELDELLDADGYNELCEAEA
ncbi:glycine cleavage system protein H [Marinobacterium aestuarii]|uniref:Glycine cleavage system H protein n=1 Tax=Marinobacterium aestuarii TaxID=1821621 RepID=A0A1A9F3L3_9GAMM|nr:glycine cleavage system protein GcvH [Marinobacterium aestuarii]ANG64816.1 glycine cleavage system protein H [Marinobacterium aestuarii]